MRAHTHTLEPHRCFFFTNGAHVLTSTIVPVCVCECVIWRDEHLARIARTARTSTYARPAQCSAILEACCAYSCLHAHTTESHISACTTTLLGNAIIPILCSHTHGSSSVEQHICTCVRPNTWRWLCSRRVFAANLVTHAHDTLHIVMMCVDTHT